MRHDNRPKAADFHLLHGLTKGFFDAATLPISFFYGDARIHGIPWDSRIHRQQIDSNITHITLTATDPRTNLEIKAVCEEYADFPVLEWTVYLTNLGQENTPVIRDLLGMDARLDMPDPILQYGNGDVQGDDSFAFFDRLLNEDIFEMQPSHGMACDGAFPYMRILSPAANAGITLSVGWPGQWKAQFCYADRRVAIRAGQAETAFYLKPGETVRTPRMTLLAFTGGKNRGINLWRRWFLAHVIPKVNGEIPSAMMAVYADTQAVVTERTTQSTVAQYLDAYTRQGVKYDLLWLDAGWYADCKSHWKEVGTWEARQPNFPEGMLGIKKLCDAHGVKFMLWFDPERVYDGTKIAREHPEWLLDASQELLQEPWFIGSHLFNIGDPEARQYLTDLISDFIRENQIDWYRQDFNIWPLHFWRTNDGENRRGITENLCVQGSLLFWDELLRRNPGLRIDSCAGGGRRSDMESMRRAVPLHYSDLAYGNIPVKMGFEQTMHEWLPYFKSKLFSWEQPDGSYSITPPTDRAADAYVFYSALAPMVTLLTEATRDGRVFDPVREMQDIWRRAANLMLRSDFYALTDYHKNADGWWCRQFDCPEGQEGFLHFLTGNRCAQTKQIVTPWLDETATYEFENAQTGERRTMTGRELLAGFAENLPARSGSIWFYRMLK